MHKVQGNQAVRILTLQVAVPADADPSQVADEFTSLLTGATAEDESNVLDWQYVPGCGPEQGRIVIASDEPEECEVFGPDAPAPTGQHNGSPAGYSVTYTYTAGTDANSHHAAAVEAIRHVDENGIDEATLLVTDLATGVTQAVDACGIELDELFGE